MTDADREQRLKKLCEAFATDHADVFGINGFVPDDSDAALLVEALEERERLLKVVENNVVTVGKPIIEKMGRYEARISQLESALREALPILQEFARTNPKWQCYFTDVQGGVEQDPMGVHRLIAAARVLAAEEREDGA